MTAYTNEFIEVQIALCKLKNNTMAKELLSVLHYAMEATRKHRQPPQSLSGSALIVMKEAGEIAKAGVEFCYHNAFSFKSIAQEAVQTDAVAIRFRINLDQQWGACNETTKHMDSMMTKAIWKEVNVE